MAVETGRGSISQTGINAASTSTTSTIPVHGGQSTTVSVAITSATTWTAGSVWVEQSFDGGTTWTRVDEGEITYDKTATGIGFSKALIGLPPGLLRARTNAAFSGSVDVVLRTY